ncbi:MAG: hypothetical protein JWM53_155 [bacterium]|nr:hypothetical protein [bacterium]
MSRKEKPQFEVEMPPAIDLPPPAAPSADRFALLVGGQSAAAAQQPARSRPAAGGVEELAQERRGARTHARKRDGATLRRLHVRLPLELERQLKRYCVDRERAAGDVVVDALRVYLADGGE